MTRDLSNGINSARLFQKMKFVFMSYSHSCILLKSYGITLNFLQAFSFESHIPVGALLITLC